jgi:proteasome lid subunit RPN8/RPN11
MSPRLVLSPALKRALSYEAERAAPDECCGVLLGREKPTGERAVSHILPATNVAAAARHQSYLLDPRALLVAERWREVGLTVLGVYHSHPDAEPSPSPSDRAASVVGWSYIIIGWRRGQVPTLKSFRCEAGEFFEEQIWYDVKGGGENRREEK